MLIYLINILLLVVWNLIFLKGKRFEKHGKKYFCIFASLQWFVLSAFRHFDVGSDTWYYGRLFETTAEKSWATVIQNAKDVLTGRMEGRDVGYSFFEKFISVIYNDYRFLLIVVAAIFAVCLGIFIYKNSQEPFFSFLLFSCLFYSFFAITGIRQTLATSIVIFLGHGLIKKRKFIWFFILTILMSFIHKSCLACLALYFLSNKKITKNYMVFVLFGFAFCFIFRTQVFELLTGIFGYDYYEKVEGAGAWTFTILLLLVFVVLFYFVDFINIEDRQNKIFINSICLALVLSPLTFVEPNTMRIVQYFSVYLMLIFPSIFNSFESRSKTFMEIALSIVLIALFISTNPIYYFG